MSASFLLLLSFSSHRNIPLLLNNYTECVISDILFYTCHNMTCARPSDTCHKESCDMCQIIWHMLLRVMWHVLYYLTYVTIWHVPDHLTHVTRSHVTCVKLSDTCHKESCIMIQTIWPQVDYNKSTFEKNFQKDNTFIFSLMYIEVLTSTIISTITC